MDNHYRAEVCCQVPVRCVWDIDMLSLSEVLNNLLSSELLSDRWLLLLAGIGGCDRAPGLQLLRVPECSGTRA